MNSCRNLGLVPSLFCLFALFWWGGVAQAKTTHLLFLIHGIQGSKSHFGFTKEALEAWLPREQTSERYQIIYYEYETGNNQLRIDDFAADFSTFVERARAQYCGAKGEVCRYSLLMHSQGGLVGALWLYRCYLNSACSKVYFENLRYLITLGTPFWGTEIAHFAQHIYAYELLPVGKRELEQLSLSSDLIDRVLRVMNDHAFLTQLQRWARIYNVVGVIKNFDLFRFFPMWEKNDLETDSVVAVPSAQLNHHAYVESSAYDYPDELLTSYGQFTDRTVGETLFVSAVHLNVAYLLVDQEFMPGIAQVYKSCVVNRLCSHPTFDLLLAILKGESVRELGHYQFGIFYIDLKVHHPVLLQTKIEARLSPQERDFTLLETKRILQTPTVTKLRLKVKSNRRLLYNHPTLVPLAVMARGLKARHFEVKASPGKMSYVEFFLQEKNLPTTRAGKLSSRHTTSTTF